MQIFEERSFKIEPPKEEIVQFFLYYAEDSSVNTRVFVSVREDDEAAAQALNLIGVPMKCQKVEGTEKEILKYSVQLEKERGKLTEKEAYDFISAIRKGKREEVTFKASEPRKRNFPWFIKKA